MGDRGHPCPATGCGLTIPPHKLLCRAHWALVPRALQRAVYGAWDHGRGGGTPAHRAAILAAVDAVNTRLAEGEPPPRRKPATPPTIKTKN